MRRGRDRGLRTETEWQELGHRRAQERDSCTQRQGERAKRGLEKGVRWALYCWVDDCEKRRDSGTRMECQAGWEKRGIWLRDAGKLDRSVTPEVIGTGDAWRGEGDTSL